MGNTCRRIGSRAGIIALVGLLCLIAGGCRLFYRRPPGPPLPQEEVLEDLRQRSEQFHTVVDGDVSLVVSTRTNGDWDATPRLGGLIAFDRDVPALWLRTEKLGRRIFSLRATDRRFSLLLPDTREVVTGGPLAYARLPHLVRPDEVRAMFAGPDLLGLNWASTDVALRDGRYVYDVHVLGQRFRRVVVDAVTGDVRSIQRYDVLGRLLTEIQLGNYTDVDGTAFPRRLVVTRPRQGVRVDLRLGSPDLNKPIPDSYFRPHEAAGYRRIDLDRQPLSEVEAFRGD